MNYKIESTEICGLYKIHLTIYEDERGSFTETFRENIYEDMGIKESFVQDMTSISKKNVLRGMHYQIKKPAGKLISASRGRVLDVAVDLRLDSPTFGKFKTFELKENDGLQVYLPPGIAHGFFAIGNINELRYRSTQYYDPNDEAGLLWNDPDVAIDWGIGSKQPIINERDSNFPRLQEIRQDNLPNLI